MKISRILLFLFTSWPLWDSDVLQAREALHQYKVYSKFGSSFTELQKKISTPYHSETVTHKSSVASFDFYLQYSLIYRNFYFSISPEYRFYREENYLRLKGMELQFMGEKFTLSLGKVPEPRMLAQNRDYL
ncbi:MAG: hypothetical protein AAF975_06400, partial [Spirochaetota bacterium]